MTDIYSGLWNDDLNAAPKSYYEDVARMVKDAQQTVKRLVSVYIIAAYDGGKVSRTRWLPDEDRWEGFAKGQQPEKWLPYPEYPSPTTKE